MSSAGRRAPAGVLLEGAMGHAHAIAVDPPGYRGAADPRPDGTVIGS